MKPVLVNDNGKIESPQQVRISIFDRGFLFGDSLYEVFRASRESITQLGAHLDRLEASARLCRIKLDQSRADLERELVQTLEAYCLENPTEEFVYLRLIISRGISKIGFGQKMIESKTQFWIIAKPLPLISEADVTNGLKLVVSDRIRNHPKALDPAMKSGNYLNNLLAFLDAEERGFDDALLCNQDGHLTEGTTFNIFYIRRGIVATPPLNIGILDGITRRDVIGVIRECGIPVREVRFSKDHLLAADEAFVTSTIREVQPITQIDSSRIGTGAGGKTTIKIREAYQEWIKRH